MTRLRTQLAIGACLASFAGCADPNSSTTSAGLGTATAGTTTAGSTSVDTSASDSATDSASASGTSGSAGTSADGTATGSADATTQDATGDSTGADESTSATDATSGETTEGSSSSSTGEDPPDTHQLYQGAFNGAQYEFGFGGAIEILDITGGPADTDWTRWAMLNDNGSYRLYFMQEGTDDTIYQFVYNPATQDYEYGLGAAIDQLGITGAPADADLSSFAMLYGQDEFRLYAQSASDPLRVHQFAYNAATQSYEYGFDNAIPEIDVTGFPGATDFSGWGMLWEDENYRFYAFSDAGHDAIAQGSWNSASGDYEFGFNSIPVIDIIGFPADTNTDDFAMLHDGDDFRLYMLRE